jgi:hypothetical protein
MHGYIPEMPLHHAITYIPFTYSIDPDEGLVALLNTTTEYIKMLKKNNPSFDSNTKRFLIESEESDKTFGIIELGFEEFIFAMIDKSVFETIASELKLTIYRKGNDIGTSRFSAKDLIGTLEGIIRRLFINHILDDLI